MAPAPAGLKRTSSAIMPLLLGLALLGCSTAKNAGPTPGPVSRKILSPGEQQLIVNGGGRNIRSLVLLPAGYNPGRIWPLLLAVHNFGGDAAGFAKLIHADRFTGNGILVLLPEAAGWIPEWQGPGVTITVGVWQPDGKRVDDTAGIAETLSVARQLYPIDQANINVAGFSQGATLAIALTRRLDHEQPGQVRRLFVAAGSVARPIGHGPLFQGSDVTLYEPGRNGMQRIANVLTGEPGARKFVPEIVAAMDCVAIAHTTANGVDRTDYRCRDGARLTTLLEPKGEHAWPGQPARYDSWLMGRGSRSHVDFTNLIEGEITERPAPPPPANSSPRPPHRQAGPGRRRPRPG
ncbi:MAG: hypothetical protein ACREFJ_18950 [Acetobacteraceae bacterium]